MVTQNVLRLRGLQVARTENVEHWIKRAVNNWPREDLRKTHFKPMTSLKRKPVPKMNVGLKIGLEWYRS